MGRSSKSIKLALIGSAFFLAGCQPEAVPVTEPEDDRVGAGADWGDDTAIAANAAGQGQANAQGTTTHHRGGMPIFIPIPIGGGGMRGGVPGGGGMAPGAASAPSARGGFGTTSGSAVS